MRRAPIVRVMALLLGLAACGSGEDSGDGAGDEASEAAEAPAVSGATTPPPDATQVATVDTSAPPAEGPVDTAAPAPPPSAGNESTEPPPEVGAVLLGTAVATVSGGDIPREQDGDVERVDQRCYGVGTLVGLEEGSPVTVRDVASGEQVGAGTIGATTAVQLDDSEDGRPRWDCSFPFRIELTAPATEVVVQIAGLPELIGAVEDGALTVVVPNDVTSPKPSLPDESVPEVETSDVSELSLPGY